jgi:hypothetical protein
MTTILKHSKKVPQFYQFQLLVTEIKFNIDINNDKLLKLKLYIYATGIKFNIDINNDKLLKLFIYIYM